MFLAVHTYFPKQPTFWVMISQFSMQNVAWLCLNTGVNNLVHQALIPSVHKTVCISKSNTSYHGPLLQAVSCLLLVYLHSMISMLS